MRHSTHHQATNLLLVCIVCPLRLQKLNVFFSLSPDLVQQQGLAQHWFFPQCDEQRHPAGKSERRQRPDKVWHHCPQSPTQPHQGTAVTSGTVSIIVATERFINSSNILFDLFLETSFLIAFFDLLSLPQDDDISGCAGFHLCDLRHVLCTCKLCSLPHPGESEQGQTHAVHQRSAAFPLLAGQLCLGYGKTFQMILASVFTKLEIMDYGLGCIKVI